MDLAGKLWTETDTFNEVGKIFEGKAPDHAMYEPKDIVYSAENGKLIIDYKYIVEVDGQKEERKFTSSIEMLVAAENGADVRQSTLGRNLVLKTPGTRGITHSADSEKSMEAVSEAGLLNDSQADIKFNASHVLADQFLGSGYKSSLNLIITSAEYNQVTMAEAERRLKNELKSIEDDCDGYISFDIRVTAEWKKLTDNAVYAELAQLNINEEENLLKTLHQQLKEERDPKLCVGVTYSVVNINFYGQGEEDWEIEDIEIKEDKDLQGILKQN